MRMFRWVVAAMLLALLPSLAAAQTDGRIVGTVRDSSNAFIPGATVTVKNVRTGEDRLAVTDGNVVAGDPLVIDGGGTPVGATDTMADGEEEGVCGFALDADSGTTQLLGSYTIKGCIFG